MPSGAPERVLHPSRAHRAETAVRLSDLDPEFLAAIPADQQHVARDMPVARRVRLRAGPWDPAALVAGDEAASAVLLVEEGVLVRDLVMAGRSSSQLLGPGDLLHPKRPAAGLPATRSRWAVGADGATVVVLGRRFTLATHRWPGLAAVVQHRLAEQLERGGVRTAILSLPRAEERVLGLLWHLAERWGTVTTTGVELHLPLTHELIGRLVGARRPTVSLALQLLADQELVGANGGRTWRLAHGSQDAFGRGPGDPPVAG